MEQVRHVCPLTVSVLAEDPEGLWVLMGEDILNTVESVPLNLFTPSFLNSKEFLFNVLIDNIQYFLVQ